MWGGWVVLARKDINNRIDLPARPTIRYKTVYTHKANEFYSLYKVSAAVSLQIKNLPGYYGNEE